jgi:hypothetical protein
MVQMGMHHVDAASGRGKASMIGGDPDGLRPVGKSGGCQRGHPGKRRRANYSPSEIHVILLKPQLCERRILAQNPAG